ncbi:DNA-binding protein [Sulfurimonas sp.]|uniref:helix-turn-helix domain-containing protein n=1 Tax=Sulfurimonas sp. TaxID=2022749 RepID=UPI0035641478
MKKMSVADAAEFFGVSKEAIHNRIRRGSLASEMVGGQKYVNVDEKSSSASKSKKTSPSKPNSPDTKYYEFLEEQNSKLQQKVEKLEDETRSLRDQKEQMLIEEREKIESIYKEKDEQLKNIINMISSNLMLESKPEIQDSVDAEIETLEVHSEPIIEENWVSLKEFLKSSGYKKEKRKKIEKEFFKKAKKGDESILIKKDKCYIDPERFAYSL